MNIKMKKIIPTIVRHFFLLSVAFVSLVPFYIAIVNAFKHQEDIYANPMSIPFRNLTLDNLIRNFNAPNFNVPRAYFFTISLVLVTLFLVVVIASMLSYILSRNRKGFYRVAYMTLLAGMLIPIQVILIPIIQILKFLGLMLSAPGLVLLYIAWYMPFTTFVLTGYISTISPQLDESARMDGAGPITIFFRIIFPLMKPALSSVVIFVMVWTWNDFITPFVIFGSSKFYTVTTGIYRAIGQYTQKWDDVFAILFFAITPLAVMYIWLQKFFISGLTSGSIKN